MFISDDSSHLNGALDFSISRPFPFLSCPNSQSLKAHIPHHPTAACRNHGVLQMSDEVNLGEDDVESTTLVDTLGTKLTPHGTVFLDWDDWDSVVMFFGGLNRWEDPGHVKLEELVSRSWVFWFLRD